MSNYPSVVYYIYSGQSEIYCTDVDYQFSTEFHPEVSNAFIILKESEKMRCLHKENLNKNTV
jgi:hypothetical protein